MVLLTKAMALDHGADGIRVNCICPGDIETPMLRSEAEQLGRPFTELLAESASVPLGRVGRPEDVAQAAVTSGAWARPPAGRRRRRASRP